MDIKHWILFQTMKHNKLALPIEDIISIDTFSHDDCTTIYVGNDKYYVLDSIEDIVKRINQIVYGTE
jgi:uncharacterized protein (UPF0305 family)